MSRRLRSHNAHNLASCCSTKENGDSKRMLEFVTRRAFMGFGFERDYFLKGHSRVDILATAADYRY